MAALDVSGIAEDLRELGYKGLLLNDEDLHQAIIDGLASQPFIQLVMSLVKELTEGLSLTEAITTPSGMDDMESFSMEMRALLKEMDCDHQSLVQDLTALSLPDNRLTLLGTPIRSIQCHNAWPTIHSTAKHWSFNTINYTLHLQRIYSKNFWKF
jgi:hypothetical protein